MPSPELSLGAAIGLAFAAPPYGGFRRTFRLGAGLCHACAARTVETFNIATIQKLLNNQNMKKETAVTVFESLASSVRLDVFRLLVRHAPGGLVAGEIAAALGLPATNLSFHLKALTQAGLLSVTQEGRFQRYRANMALMGDLVAYLTDECCGGHPEACLGHHVAVTCTDCP